MAIVQRCQGSYPRLDETIFNVSEEIKYMVLTKELLESLPDKITSGICSKDKDFYVDGDADATMKQIEGEVKERAKGFRKNEQYLVNVGLGYWRKVQSPGIVYKEEDFEFYKKNPPPSIAIEYTEISDEGELNYDPRQWGFVCAKLSDDTVAGIRWLFMDTGNRLFRMASKSKDEESGTYFINKGEYSQLNLALGDANQAEINQIARIENLFNNISMNMKNNEASSVTKLVFELEVLRGKAAEERREDKGHWGTVKSFGIWVAAIGGIVTAILGSGYLLIKWLFRNNRGGKKGPPPSGPGAPFDYEVKVTFDDDNKPVLADPNSDNHIVFDLPDSIEHIPLYVMIDTRTIELGLLAFLAAALFVGAVADNAVGVVGDEVPAGGYMISSWASFFSYAF